LKKVLLLLSVLIAGNSVFAQRFLTDMMDTSTSIGKGLYPIYQKSDRLRFGGYMQPQFQWAESKGVKNYAGGDFAANSNNRFMLRRGRIRVDYAHFNEKNQPLAIFAFQFDGTERGVNIRDFWGRLYENKLEMFALTTGMFARPFGFEANLSSSDRETPERGRMSQILMRTERDLGVMGTFELRKKNYKFRWLKVDLGIFNGQGLAGPVEYDYHKDFIGRVSLKPYKIKNLNWTVSASASGYYGGIVSKSPWIYEAQGIGANAKMKGDSVLSNVDRLAPRQYAGADFQLKIPNRKKGFSEFRAEYIRGMQTSTANTTETPGSDPVNTTTALPLPLYVRPFDGAYFYYLQHLFREDLQLVLKYDWYDPNRAVKGKEVDPAKGFTAADVRHNTLSAGFLYYVNAHVKLFLYYDWIENESTLVKGYTTDIKDNIITCRLQFRF
jgi:hypothetical protein